MCGDWAPGRSRSRHPSYGRCRLLGGSGLSDASIAVTTFAAGTFFMAVPPVLSDLVSAPNAPNWSGRGREDRRSKFYEVSDNLK